MNALEKSKYLEEYKENYHDLVNYIFLHQPKSPYSEPSNNLISKAIQVTTNRMTDLTEQIIRDNSKEEIISILRQKESKQCDLMYDYYYQNINDRNGIEPPEKYIKNSFEEKIKKLNLLYLNFIKYHTKQFENGYFDYSKFAKDNRNTTAKLLQDFYNCFNIDNNKILSLVDSKDFINVIDADTMINKLEDQIHDFLETLENDRTMALNDKNYEYSALYDFCLDYFTGRSVSMINDLKQKISKGKELSDNFEDTKQKFMNKFNNNNLKDKIKSSTKQKVHYKYKEISGSFFTTIEAPPKGGFAVEYISNALHNFNCNLKFGNKISSTVTGGDLSVLKVSQKKDIQISFKVNEKVADIKNNNLIRTDYSKVGWSLKNYKVDSDVTIHSGGNFDRLVQFLQTYKNSQSKSADDYVKLLNSAIFKYIFLNESWESKRSQSTFINKFKDTLSMQGSIFTLTPFLITKEANLIDESVDFLVINGKIIPGSMILEAALEVIKNEKNIQFKTTISYPSDLADIKYEITTDSEGKKHKKKVSDKTIHRKWEKTDLYSKNYLQARFNNSKNLLSQYNFTMHMAKNFRKYLEDKVSNIGG